MTEELCARHEAEPQEGQLPPGVWELLAVHHLSVSSQVHLFSENKIKCFRVEGEQQKGRVFCFVVVHIFDYDMHVIRAGICYRNTNKLCSKRR